MLVTSTGPGWVPVLAASPEGTLYPKQTAEPPTAALCHAQLHC